MRGLWGRWWRRGLAIVVATQAVAWLAALALILRVLRHRSVLDFAGGAVIHLNPLPPLVIGLLIWACAEFLRWINQKRPAG
jgi:hypothetical protein